MEKINDQMNSCFLVGKIVGKISRRESELPSLSECSFTLRNHYSFWDESIRQDRFGDSDFKVKFFGSFVKSVTENLETGDIVDIQGKILSPSSVFGYRLNIVKKKNNKEKSDVKED